MKKNLFLITEEERERILGMHKRATASQYLSEAGPFEDTDPLAATTPPAAGTTPPAAGTTPPAAGTTPPAAGTTPPTSQILMFNDGDYEYKKDGEKYYFKLQPNPVSATAKQYKTSGKFLGWTEAKGKGLEAIKKLDFKPETLDIASVKGVKVTPSTTVTSTDTTQTNLAATGGGGGKQIIDPIGDAKATMPKIDTLNPTVAKEVIAWSKTPSGQYVLNTPADQREAAIDNLDRRRGDEETRRLKKEIRQALGMAADTLAGKVGSSIRGGIQGLKQGFQQQTT